MFTVVFQSYRGHFGPSSSSREKRQRSLFERLTGKKTLTAEEWKKREEELIERMLKLVVMDQEDAWSMDRPINSEYLCACACVREEKIGGKVVSSNFILSSHVHI